MCKDGQAFKQSQRVIRGNVFPPTTQTDEKRETHIKRNKGFSHEHFVLTTDMPIPKKDKLKAVKSSQNYK